MPAVHGLMKAVLCVLASVAAIGLAGPADNLTVDTYVGGVGGVYFLAEPGELVVQVAKRDRNRSTAVTELRAVLAGPDRRVCAEAVIPDDGQAGGKLGPARSVRLATRVERKGVYVLNVTVSQDRYGEAMVWGVASNCPRYLIETARGHRDRRHEEPIVLLNPDRPGNVCFQPRAGAFEISASGLPAAGRTLSLYDGRDQLLATLQADAAGKVTHSVAAAKQRENIPWRLALPVGQATIEIDGLTRWDRGDPCPDSCLWTPNPKSFFPLADYRWLLTPYSRTVYGRAGQTGEVTFSVHNNAPSKRTIELTLEFPGEFWPVQLSAERVELAARQRRNVTLSYYTFPETGSTATAHLRATPVEDPTFSTYATLIVKAGAAPADAPLSLPLVLKPYQHENEQLGYLQEYPLENQLYFDLKNQPWVRTAAGASHWRDGHWQSIDLKLAVTSCEPPQKNPSFGMASSKIAFDRDGDAYLLAQVNGQGALLHSNDGGTTFRAYVLLGGPARQGALDIEEFSGHNRPDGPPPVLRYLFKQADPKHFWRRIHDLELFLPSKRDGRLAIGSPQLISENCIGLANHSGIPGSVVSRDGRVHVAWGEATDPALKVPGLPAFVRSYDRGNGPLGPAVLVAYGPPANDIHNSPSITLDSQGFLHILAGTHGKPFPYVQSREANTAHGGFTEPVLTGEGLDQTYIGLVCGPDDTLHAAFRLWQRNQSPFPNSHHATLAYQQKPRGKPWQKPQILVVPPFSEYSVFRHRLTIDRQGRLFMPYKCWSTFWFYRNDGYGDAFSLLTSPDQGRTWRLALGTHLAPRDEGTSRGAR